MRVPAAQMLSALGFASQAGCPYLVFFYSLLIINSAFDSSVGSEHANTHQSSWGLGALQPERKPA